MMPLVPALLAILAAPPQPGAGSVAIVDVDAPDTMVGQAMQTTKSIVEAANALRLTVITPDQLRARMNEKSYAALIKCNGQPACVAQFSASIGATRVVLSSLNRNEKNYLLKMWLIDLERLEVVADVDRQVLIASRRLHSDVEQAAPALLRGEREAKGTLKISSNAKNAQLSINGDFVGTTPYETQLKPGKYEVKLEKANYLSVTRLVNVEANATTVSDLTLLLIPGAIPDDEPAGSLGAKPESPASASPSRGGRLTGTTLVAGGLAAVALGVGIGFGVVSKTGDSAITNSLDATTQVYASTRKDALAVRQNALIANVAFGVAGAAAVATVILAVLDVTSGRAKVEVAPVVSSSSAGLTFGGRF